MSATRGPARGLAHSQGLFLLLFLTVSWAISFAVVWCLDRYAWPLAWYWQLALIAVGPLVLALVLTAFLSPLLAWGWIVATLENRTYRAIEEAGPHWAGRERSCPKCGTSFTSVQNLGHCPGCKLIFYASHPDVRQG